MLIDLKDFKRELEFSEILGRSTSSVSSDKTTVMTAAQTVSSAGYIFGEIKRHNRGVVAVLAILIVSAIGLGYWFFSNRAVSTNVSRIESIAVMPFVNDSGNADIEHIADGITETLIGNLSQLPNLNVTARSTVSRYKGKGTNPQTIGKELNVQVVVYGRIVQRGEQLTLNLNAVAMVDARAGFGMWTAQYDLELSDLISLQRAIAQHVAALLRNNKLSKADEQKIAKNYTESSEAYQLYLRGNFHAEKRTEKEIRKGIEYLEQAIAVDPNYALAYAGLARAYIMLPTYTKVRFGQVIPKIKNATSKALSLEDDLADAHAILGYIMTTEGDDAGAEREYQRAIDLNPNSAMVYHFYSNLLRIEGKLNEAIDKQRRAVELEPLSVIINREYGSKLFFARKYDEAIAQFNKTIELDANFPSAHYGLALVYWARGDYPEAVEEHAKYQELNGEPNKAALLRESFVKGGWQGFLRTVTDDSKQIDLSGDDLTAYYAASGEKDKAFALLNERFERRIRPGNLVDPHLDPLHDDPRFTELLARVE